MKKRIVALSVFLVVFVLAIALFATAADDYKVIKNAIKSSETSATGQKSVQWFKILVTEKDGSKEKVKISLPISLVEMMINACPEEKFEVDHGCQIDIRKIWNELKKAGPLALIEVEDHGETVKIWFE
ncbi:MAG: hypothetical protein L6428_05030 [Candidatus Aminicenantes bacterium]|nr:hypothetical protein [Acidobacteriota bacterium]MCG2810804.1 hypothetical protein [Candidatus Aminicenantes bacterium]